MARLTQKQRDNLPNSAFAGPNRTYPIPDKKHAIIAAGLAGMHGASGKIKANIAKKAAAKGVHVGAGRDIHKEHDAHCSRGGHCD